MIRSAVSEDWGTSHRRLPDQKNDCGKASNFTPIRIGWIVNKLRWCPTPEPAVHSWTIPGAAILPFSCKLANAAVGNRDVRNDGRQMA